MSTNVSESCQRFPKAVRARLWLTFEGKVSPDEVLYRATIMLSTYKKVSELRTHFNAITDEQGEIIGWTTTGMMLVTDIYEGSDGTLLEDASSVHNL